MNLALTPFVPFPGLRLFRLVHKLATMPASRAVPSSRVAQPIDKGATLVVSRAAQATVACLSGCLWITHDGDPGDIVICAGESYTSKSASRMLVHGLEASCAILG